MELLSTDNQSGAMLRPQGPGSGRSAFGDLDTEQFVKIIFAELSNQDPLAPNDSKALLEQLASLRSIQSDTDMTSRLSKLVSQNELAAASGLIGRRISGLSEEFQRVDGIVGSVSRSEEGAILNLRSGERVPMSSLDRVLGESGENES